MAARSFKDLRGFISFLESRGQLVRVHAPVSCELEITEIAHRTLKSDGPALLFENVQGYSVPVLVNMFGTRQRMSWALGVDDIEELAARVRKLLGMTQSLPQSLMDKLRSLGDLAQLASFQPRVVSSGPCQEAVFTGEQADVTTLPILKCWPMDGGRYVTLPLVITRDPETGTRNAGMYRMQVYDGRTLGMHWQAHKVGTHHERVAYEKGLSKLEVAVALGGDPTTIWTGSVPLPPQIDEFLVAGFIREEGIEMVKTKTVDLEVPAHAEIIIEGYIVPGETRLEGPFGDHTGYYSMPDHYPVMHVTAVTHRRKPIYPATVVGRPPMEDYWMGKMTERLFLPAVQMLLPEVVDINMPAEGVFHNLVIVSIRKEYPGQAQKVMYGLWGMGLMALAKAIIVVDANVNVHDLSEVAWRVTSNLAPERDITIVQGPLDDLNHASPVPRAGSKMGIDATAKGPADGHTRAWPPDIVMAREIKELVDGRWKEYGL